MFKINAMMKTHRLKFWGIICFAALSMNLNAQNPVKEKLSWMIGDWSGGGWVSQGPGTESGFNQTENITWGAGETVIMIKGKGTDLKTGEMSFEAAGMIYYEPKDQSFHMHSFTNEMGGIIADLKVTGDRKAEWGFDVPGGHIVYKIDASSGKWNEKGFFSPDGTDQEYPMFEMTVERTDVGE